MCCEITHGRDNPLPQEKLQRCWTIDFQIGPMAYADPRSMTSLLQLLHTIPHKQNLYVKKHDFLRDSSPVMKDIRVGAMHSNVSVCAAWKSYREHSTVKVAVPVWRYMLPTEHRVGRYSSSSESNGAFDCLWFVGGSPLAENCCSQLVFLGFTYNKQHGNKVKRNNTAECIASHIPSKASLGVIKKKHF